MRLKGLRDTDNWIKTGKVVIPFVVPEKLQIRSYIPQKFTVFLVFCKLPLHYGKIPNTHSGIMGNTNFNRMIFRFDSAFGLGTFSAKIS